MKHFKRSIVTSILFVLMFAMIQSCTVEAATSTVSQQNKIESWISTCQKVGNNLVKKKFKYSNSNVKATYGTAVKKRKVANCARFVSWCMQEAGLIKKGQWFYVSGSGKIRKNFGSWGKKVKIIRINKKCKKVSLKEGDIVCWKGAHVNIYAGKNSSGTKTWIDGGKVATASNRSGSKYKTAGKKKTLSYLNNRTISYVIRVKG